jgi:Putative lumazine-binding
MTYRLRRSYPAVLVAFCLATVATFGDARALGDYQQGSADTAAVQRVVDDYIGLYRRDRLEAWKALFVPGFTATYTNDDGSVTTRSLDDFYERQRAGFERGSMSETLANVRIQRVGKLAHVFADFKFTSGTITRPGQLMLLLITVKGEWKIAALMFTYHLES